MRPGAVTIGVFDGLHLGHLAILERMLSRARAADGVGAVVSFDPHPDVVLKKSFQAVAPLTPLPEKRARLAAMGVGHFELLPFTRELAALSAEEFVERHLVQPFAPRALVVGENFACAPATCRGCARSERRRASRSRPCRCCRWRAPR